MDCFQSIAQLKLEVQRLALVKLAFEPLFILDILFWGMGNNPQDSFTRIEKIVDLQVEIWSTKFPYAFQSIAQLKLEVQRLSLVKLAFEPLFILDILFWGMGNNPRDSFTRIEKIEDLQVEIWSTKFPYAKQVKLAWDRIYWE
jgi:hypothetical protein